MNVINKACPICGNNKLKWRNPDGFFHAFQECDRCGCSVGFKRFHNRDAKLKYEMINLKSKITNLKSKIEKFETLAKKRN